MMVIIEKTIPVKFYKEVSGREPVRDWLMELKKDDRRIIGTDIKTVQLRWPLGYPIVSPIDTKLWEVRSNLDNRISRVLFTFKDGTIFLLHGFIKKTPKTPPNEIAIAKKRMKNLEE